MDRAELMALVAVGLALLGLLLSFSAHRRIALSRRPRAFVDMMKEGKNLASAASSYLAEARKVKVEVERLSEAQRETSRQLAAAPRNIGLVRYDAFEDMGGRMSFSAAFLDDNGDGIVLTSINGRTEARTYAKVIEGGGSDHNLSPEEKEAIAEALSERTRARR